MKKTFLIILIFYISMIIFLQLRYFYYGGNQINFWLSVFLVILSVISLHGMKSGLNHFISVRYIFKNGVSANAVIKDFNMEYYRTKTYYPVIQFCDTSKIKHKYQSKVGMSIVTRKYKKGSKVKIAYIEEQPDKFIITPAYYYQSLMEIFMFSFIGIPSLIASVILVIR
ncbi:MAG: DUF3592 domain-containing protein [Ruminococcus sp.]|nr:DUF3592 domain-containing protein [Ruminococcus sp.]